MCFCNLQGKNRAQVRVLVHAKYIQQLGHAISPEFLILLHYLLVSRQIARLKKEKIQLENILAKERQYSTERIQFLEQKIRNVEAALAGQQKSSMTDSDAQFDPEQAKVFDQQNGR